MATPLYLVDAFAATPFAGNPAAVCLLDASCPDEWMQALAAEMNLSETAFVLTRPGSPFGLRWFTPKVEVDLCGHATLASAHVLWQSGRLASDEPARFQTRSGLLTAARSGEDVTLDFPAVGAQRCDDPGLALALGSEVRWVGRNGMDCLVEVPDERSVRELRPDFARLADLPVRGVIVTAAGSGRYDFVSRFFAPRVGVPEDPVTGSAHCALGPFWAARLGKDDLIAYQASARGGEVKVGVRGERVLLGGRAVTVVRGEVVG